MQSGREEGALIMKAKKTIIAVVAVLIALVVIFAFVHNHTRTKATEGALQIVSGGKTSYVQLDDIKAGRVQGTLVNGKGEESAVDAEGICTEDLLSKYSYSSFTAVADDEYKAEVAASEASKAYIISTEKGLQLVVFGDSNSKRAVRNLIRLELK